VQHADLDVSVLRAARCALGESFVVATDVVMPRLSDSMEEGTILRWVKSPGDQVERGEELVEIETDKANMIYEADVSGTLIEVIAEEGATLPIGEVIARIGEPGETPAGGAAPAKATASAAAEPPSEDTPASPSAPPGTPGAEPATSPAEARPAPTPAAGDGRVKASPLARRIARDRGLDLTGLAGSGPGGRIIKADVERAIAAGPTVVSAPEAAPPPVAAPAGPTPGVAERPETAKGTVSFEELTRLQSTVARRMAESKATAPHFYLSVEVDMSRAVEARPRIKAAAAKDQPVPSFNDMVVKAAAIALREHPRANGAYRDGRLELYSRVNVGVAVAARDALVVPTVFDADRKGLRQIASETRALAERVREGTITPPELSGGTFAVSNLGMFGISNFAAVINPPQAAILAVGAIATKPVVRDGEIAIGSVMPMTLACDHRILYGADGARFLDRIRSLLEEPLGLAL
jgi:pyruvate dehydrogenase E2 component (dihydrolipoamide acetyltransferase)